MKIFLSRMLNKSCYFLSMYLTRLGALKTRLVAGEADAATFYSTLAQISTGMLAIFAAALITYLAYIDAKRTQYDDAIQEDRLQIAETLKELRSLWPAELDELRGTTFDENYRYTAHHDDAHHQPMSDNKGAWGLIWQASSSLACDRVPTMCAEMWNASNTDLILTTQVLSQDGVLRGPWRGRVYFWVLTRAVEWLDGPRALSSIKTNQQQERTDWSAGRAFPIDSEGPGFEKWRRDFENLDWSLKDLSAIRTAMVVDYQSFCATLSNPKIGEELGRQMGDAVDRFFIAVGTINLKLGDLDRQSALRSRYLPNRLHVKTFAVLGLAAWFFGVAIPTILLVQKDGYRSSRLCIALLAFGFAWSAFWLLGRDVSVPPPISDPAGYLNARWYLPLIEHLELRARIAIRDGWPVDRSIFADAANTDDTRAFPAPLNKALIAFLDEMNRYNSSIADLDKMSAEVILSGHEYFVEPPTIYSANFSSNDPSAQWSWMNIYSSQILEEESWNRQNLLKYCQDSNTRLVLGTKIQIRCSAFHQEQQAFKGLLERTRVQIAGSSQAERFLQERQRANDAVERLRRALSLTSFQVREFLQVTSRFDDY